MSKTQKKGLVYVISLDVGLLMIYPLTWPFFATFKTNQELFGKLSLWPERFSPDGIIDGWKGSRQFTYTALYKDTSPMVVPTMVFTVLFTGVVAYGSARFGFPCKKILFLLVISTLVLSDSVIIIPRYVLLHKSGWADTYVPFWMPGLLACYPLLIFMQAQFLRGISRELDEPACVDEYNPFMTYIKILFPLMKPTVFSMIIFQFLWRWNDYFNNLIYISNVKKYTLSLAFKMSIDRTGAVTQRNQVLSMPFLPVILPMLLYFFAQDCFVEGITAGGVKG